MRSFFASALWTWSLPLVILLGLLPGCASQSISPPNPVPSPAQTGAPASASTSVHALSYDFPDIPVPRELELQTGDSNVYREGDLKAGVISLKGRVEIGSLISFFQSEMPRQGWVSKGGFRYRRSVLVFEKENRTCVISMHETLLFTYVEIYVIPMHGTNRQ